MRGKEIEEGVSVVPNYGKLESITKKGMKVIPVVVQDVDSMEVLMCAWVNHKALLAALEKGVAAFWSTSRNELWIKGEKSGNYLDLLEVRIDCDQDSYLYLVRKRKGGVCHTKNSKGNYRGTCFYRKIADRKGKTLKFIEGGK